MKQKTRKRGRPNADGEKSFRAALNRVHKRFGRAMKKLAK